MAATFPDTRAVAGPATGRRATVHRRVRPSHVLWLLAVGALLLRLIVDSGTLTVIDRLFIPDDTYYTLSIARSLAHGLPPAADGIHATSGFQPLIAFLLVPVFALTGNPDIPLRVALVIGAVADAAVVLLVGRLACRVAGPAAAVTAAALWAVAPLAVSNASNGLETSLALACQLLLVEAWCLARERGGTLRWVLAGALAGLALLARIDTVFLVAVLGLLQLARGPRRPMLGATAAAATVVAPWWLYCTVRFGSPVPESGAAVAHIVAVHQSLGLTWPLQIEWALGSALGLQLDSQHGLRADFASLPLLTVVTCVVLAVGLLSLAGWLASKRDGRVAVAALPMQAIAIFLFYGFVEAAPWFYARYLAPVEVVLVLFAGVLVGLLWRACRGRAALMAKPILAAGVCALAAFGLTGSVGYLTAHPTGSAQGGYDGITAYRETARQILSLAPANAVIGSLQSGALSYFAGPGQRIVNLDGVVDGAAAKAVAGHRLADFARRRGVSYLADWQFNVNNFFGFSSRSVGPLPKLELVGTAAPQRNDQFQLYRVIWPPA